MNPFQSALYSLIILCLSISLSYQSSLYSPDDPLWELNSSNFDKHVFGKSNAWIIQFYNSWCGHCIRFAPTWKEFARNIQTWKTVVEVGAVNCNDKENVALCRQYDVQVFPTIKLFWHHVNETESGMLFTSSRSISSMESGIVSFLDSHWNEGIPHTWPDLEPIEEKDMHSLVKTIPKDKQSIFVYVEHPDSFIGRKIILDLSFQKNHVIRRLLSTSELLNDLKSIQSNETVPALIEINKNSNEDLVMRFSKEDNDTEIRNKIFERLLGEPRIKTKSIEPTEKPTIETFVVDNVYMSDLENAVYYSLNQEVGVSKYIQGEKLSALKAYLSILKTYFPGSSDLKQFFSNLYNWVTYKRSFITGEEFIQAIEKMQDGKNLLKMKEWVGCKGSESKYRGYPCSLWTLFHTLTVQADRMNTVGDVNNKGEVLFIIRDYIQNFFSCEECAQHFLQMAEKVESQVTSSNEAVLWLWRAHNNVNRRLAGDLTEDPKHPKIQFPSPKACPKCRTKSEGSDDDAFVEVQVLRYLHHFYGKNNIVVISDVKDEDSLSLGENIELKNSGMGIRITPPLNICLSAVLLWYISKITSVW